MALIRTSSPALTLSCAVGTLKDCNLVSSFHMKHKVQ